MPPQKRNEFGLTRFEERFCQEYLIDLNGTQAYLRAKPGVAEITARTEASRLLADHSIQARIALLVQERSERTQITADRTLLELARIAFANMRDFAAWGPEGVRLKKSEQLSPELTAAVESVQERQGKYGAAMAIKLHSKIAALEQFGSQLSLFKDKLTLEGKVFYYLEEIKKEKPKLDGNGD